MSLIDLGEVGHNLPPSEPPRSSPARRPYNRWFVIGALPALVLATMAGGAPRPGPLPEATIPARLGAETFAQGNRLFVIDPAERIDPTGTAASPSIAAYRLPDGRPLWRAPLPVGGARGAGMLDSRIVGETLVLAATTGPGPDAPPQVAGLDARTGAVLWHRSGYPVGTTPGGQVLVSLPGDGSSPQSEPGWTLAALIAETGAVRWSLPSETRFSLAGERPRDPVRSLVTVLPPRRAEVRDMETGEPVRSADLPGESFDLEYVPQIVAGLLLVRDERRGTLTAYGLDRLDRRWTGELSHGDGWFASACGDYICLWGEEGGVRVLDPRDGRTRWSDPRWVVVEGVGALLVAAASPAGCRLGRLCRNVPMAPVVLAVLDQQTGRTLGDFGAWQWIDRTAEGEQLLAIRTDARTGRAQLAHLDPATLTVRPLAMLDKISGQCATAEAVLYCRRRDASVAVWRLPE